MAKVLRQITSVGEGQKFTIIHTNADGKVTDSATYESDKPLKSAELGTALANEVKQMGNRRIMWLSLLGFVMADPKLEGYKGKADQSTGKLPDDFKKSVRTCEENYLRHLVAKGEVKLHVGKDDNAEKVFMNWATSIREDKNYSNAKSTVLRYYAIVGSHPITPSGFIVPVPVMQEAIQNVLDANKTPEEKGYYVKVLALMEAFNKDASPDMGDMQKLGGALRQWFATVEGILQHEAELATAALAGLKTVDGVKDGANAAIASAQATLASTKKGQGQAKVVKQEAETQ